MPGRIETIHSYYLSLFELLIFIVFVIVLKIVMLLLMAKFSVILSDDPKAAQQQREERKKRNTFDKSLPQKWLRLGLGVLFTASGLLQIQPRMVGISAQALSRDFHGSLRLNATHSLAAPFANLWLHHSMWMNVVSCGIQLTIGLLLLTTSHRLAVIITAVVAAAMGLADFVIMTGFGGLFSAGGSILGATSVRGLVYFGLSMLCLVPAHYWRGENVFRFIRFGIAGFWLLGVILQVVPGEGYWQSIGWSRLLQSGTSSTEPGLIAAMTRSVAGFVTPHAVVLNTVVIILMVLFAVSVVFVRWRYSQTVQISSMVFLALIWAVFEHFGFQTVFLFPMDAGTAAILALLLVRVGEHGQTKVSVVCERSKASAEATVRS
jgi:hypothetical protein